MKLKVKINLGNYESMDIETSEHEDIQLCLAELVDSLDTMIKFHVKTHDRELKRDALIWHRDLYLEMLSNYDEAKTRQLEAKKTIDQRRKEENVSLEDFTKKQFPERKIHFAE